MKRLFEVDAVKFFAMVFMICIHTFEMYETWDYHACKPDSLYHNIMEILGGPFAAPVFMFCMGIVMVYTRHSSPADFIKRGFKLMLTGYVLNFFRQTLPMLIAMKLGIDTGYSLIGGLLNVDILPFAGMAFITIGLMKKKNISPIKMCVIAVLLQAAGIWATHLDIRSVAVATLLGLLLPSGEHVAFPMTLWLIYPVLGILFGERLKQTEDRSQLFRKLMAVASIIFVVYSVTLVYIGYDIRDFYGLHDEAYYYQTFLSTLWIMPLVILALGSCYFLFRNIEQTKLVRFIKYCSSNLKTIYIIQWIIIGYSYGFSILLGIEKTDSLFWLTLVGLAIMGASIGIMSLLNKIKSLRNVAGRKVILDEG
ncbi:MAG: acyltransferase family protein [Eubacterium sp.]|nr:acyltransferase family protein [Eubacterium sp.]